MPGPRPTLRKPDAATQLHNLEKDLPTGEVSDGFDRENAFMVYCSFSGDVTKAGAALGIEPWKVLRMAEDGQWCDKFAAILKLKKAGKPGDLERMLSRTMNFVQAARTRLFLGRMLKRLFLLTDEELDQYCFATITKTDKDGVTTTEYKLNTRPFADLCSAMEKCHQMTYMALNDSMSERAKRETTEDGAHSAAEIHSAISEAMSKVAADQSPRAMLFDEQLKLGQELQQQAELKRQLKEEMAK